MGLAVTGAMMPRFLIALLAIFLTACGSGSPSSPSPGGSTSQSLRGATVSAIDGQPIPSITVKIGSQTAVSDMNGAFDVLNVNQGSQTVVLTGAAIIERQTTVSIPSEGPARASLIPAAFDLAAFDQMFRGNGQLQRWTSAPGLVVFTKVMQDDTFSGGDAYHATGDQLSEAETSLMVEHLTEGLGLLTGNTYTAFSSVELESPSSGDRVSTMRSGKIVAGRFKGVQSLANTIGFGRMSIESTGRIVGGALYLDNDFDRTSDKRRLLRIHELGHGLGYLHVTSRPSIMNPAIGPEPTTFDRQGASIAFQRLPGNQSPDTDAGTAPRPGTGGTFGVRRINCGVFSSVVPES